MEDLLNEQSAETMDSKSMTDEENRDIYYMYSVQQGNSILKKQQLKRSTGNGEYNTFASK